MAAAVALLAAAVALLAAAAAAAAAVALLATGRVSSLYPHSILTLSLLYPGSGGGGGGWCHHYLSKYCKNGKR